VTIEYVDTVVVGSGVAGLTTALTAGGCAVVSKTTLGAGSSRWAQGGIAAAVGDDDAPSLHADDTLRVSGGLGDRDIAELVTGAAPDRMDWLVSLGAAFDMGDDGDLKLGREAGHSRRRIVHADGDATGAELMRTLIRAVRHRPDITVLDGLFVVDLVMQGDRVVGVHGIDEHGARRTLLAGSVVLATGGIGRVYRHTTNPREVTGDGLAMAARAGAALRDPEFVQFHPTALATSHDPMPLLTEALRGEGATLVDADGRRYMPEVHPDAELAPRDVVARANWEALRHGPIFLDATVIGAEFPHRFPTVFGYATSAGIDPRTEPLPVSPAQHYHMGGIVADSHGRTSLPGLYAVGECASTGLHGANRLASNSLLEGLVLGARTARAIGAAPMAPIHPSRCTIPETAVAITTAEDEETISRLRSLMWDHAGVVRDEAGMRKALGVAADLSEVLDHGALGRNLAGVATIVLEAALARRESRGAHWRTDHPSPDPSLAAHTTVHPLPEPRVPVPAAGRRVGVPA
jgi:L-aspartate oxidase